MKPVISWRAQKRTGAVRNKIEQDYRNLINSIHKDVTVPNSSDDYSRQGLADENAASLPETHAFCNHEVPAKKVSATTNTGQQERSYFEQQGSVHNFDEDNFNKEFFDCMPESSSDEEDDPSDLLTKQIEFREKLKDWSLRNNISHSALKDLLLILNDSFDSTISLPMDPRTILQTPREVHIKNIEGGEYWHHGCIEQLTKVLISWTSLPSTIHLIFNFDGLPIFKSAKKEFWPILAKVVEGDNDLFIIGIYYGTGKPKIIEEYLKDFVAEMKILLDNGLCINDMNVRVKIRCIVCDSPARAFIKGVCNFNGKHGCLKCTTVGEYSHVSHTVVFSTKESTPRTNDNFRTKSYGNHHKADSPLLELPIDMIKDFPVSDSLHLIDLGIMKRLLIGWRDGNFGTYLTKLRAREIEYLDTFLKKCKLPTEIHRAVRTLDCLAHWKASEFRTFLHYLSIVIIPEILRKDVVDHFMTLFCAITICSSQSYTHFLPLARQMLKHFVEEYKFFYGSHYITSNVHNLLHVVDEVEHFGPLQNFNAYPFENQLYLIKRMLRQGNKPLSQIAKRLSESSLRNLSAIVKNKNNTIPYVTVNRSISVLHFRNFVLSTKPNDKYFMTHSGDIFELKDILGEENNITLYGQKIINKEVIFETPIKSSYLNMYKAKKSSGSSTIKEIRPDEIKIKFVNVTHNNILYFLPLLHTV